MTIVLLQDHDGSLYTHEGLSKDGMHRLVNFHTHAETHITDEQLMACSFVCVDA